MSSPKRSRPTRARSRRKNQRARGVSVAAPAAQRAYAGVANAPVAPTAHGPNRAPIPSRTPDGARAGMAPAHPGARRRPHDRRAARSSARERRRDQNARQSRPNIADLPRSAPVAAIEVALRRRAAAITRPLAQPDAAMQARASASAMRRLDDSASRQITTFRRNGPALRGQVAQVSRAAQSSFAQASARITELAAPVSAIPRAIPRTLPKRPIARARIIARARSRARPHMALRVLITLAVLVSIALALIPAPILAYSNTMALAQTGLAHLKNAEADFKTLSTSPTNLPVINDAQSELQHAHDDFTQLQLRVGLLNSTGLLTHAGAKAVSAAKLLPLAVDGTQAGVLACDALKTLVTGLKNPLGTSGGLSGADVAQITSDVAQIGAIYDQMLPQLQALTPGDLTLDPRLWPLVSQLQTKLPQVTQLIDDLNGLAPLLPQLLGVGKPATYLVLVLDSSELRPTGGFIGNFGALTLDAGRLDPGFHISDITLIDSSVKFANVPNRQSIPIPGKYSWLKTVFQYPWAASWSLRDSNLDPNYPTAAQYALSLYPKLLPDAQKNLAAQHSKLQLYNPAKSGPFAGVVTLNLGFFAQALTVTGPISVPEFHQTITSQNFVSMIHNYALGTKSTGSDSKACGSTSCAKVFTSDVVKAFMAKVKSDLPLYVGKLGKLFLDSLRTKDVEIYLTAAPAQRLLRDLKLTAEVAAPTIGDSVFEVDANVGANKDNYFLHYQMADQITIDQAGAATHHLAWSYTWPRNPATLKETFAAGSPDYHAYSRVFTPPNAMFISQNGLAGFGAGAEFGRKAFHGSVSDSYAQTSKYALSWKVPNVVTYDGAGYHYHLIFQREAGIVWPLNVAVTLPACATLTGAPVTSGLSAQDTVTMKGRTVRITGPLTMDMQVEINYTCPTGSAAMPANPAFVTSKQLRDLHWRIVAARLGQSYRPRATHK